MKLAQFQAARGSGLPHSGVMWLRGKGCEGLRGRGCAPSWEQAAHARQFLSDSHDNICRYIARESGSVVVSVG